MKKYPIDRFYVGKLNIGIRFGNLLFPNSFSYRDEKQKDLKFDTMARGAINIADLCLEKVTNWEDRLMYETLFTIFYRNDDNTYTCLHNGETYSSFGMNYCSHLVPLSSCIPSISSRVDDKISFIGAKQIFKVLFKSEDKSLYNKSNRYFLDNFYLGRLDLYTGKLTEDENIAQQLMLNSKGIFPYGGCSRLKEGTEEEKNYGFYKVVVLLPRDSRMYNLNDNRVYDEELFNEEGSSIILSNSLADEEFFTDRISRDEVTIPEVLKLQRKYIQSKRQ